MVIASWPSPVIDAPSHFGYLELSTAALGRAGIDTVPLEWSAEWLRAHAGTVDAIHLHWPEYRWSRSDASVPTRIRQILALRRFLGAAGRAGVARILTVHNLEPHESPDRVDRWGMRRTARRCDLIVVHSAAVAGLVAATYRPRAPVVVMYHGAYEHVFPPPRARDVIRRELGVPAGQALIACLGTLGPYKGHDVVCDAARRLSGNARLLIAGRPRPGHDTRALAAAMATLDGATFIDRNLTPQEYADLAAASDVIVLAHRHTTGSGALLAAWSLGRGVVASDLPHFREIVSLERDCGVLFAPGDSTDLAQAVTRYLRVPAERRQSAALAQRDRFVWSRCITPFVNAVNSLRRR